MPETMPKPTTPTYTAEDLTPPLLPPEQMVDEAAAMLDTWRTHADRDAGRLVLQLRFGWGPELLRRRLLKVDTLRTLCRYAEAGPERDTGGAFVRHLHRLEEHARRIASEKGSSTEDEVPA